MGAVSNPLPHLSQKNKKLNLYDGNWDLSEFGESYDKVSLNAVQWEHSFSYTCEGHVSENVMWGVMR